VSHAAAVLEPALRVSVWAGRRRLDADLPSQLPVAELVAPLARRLDVLDEAAAVGVHLLTASGQALDPSVGLTDQGVQDGGVLCLVVGCPAPPELYDDLATAVHDVAAPPPVHPAVIRSTLLGLAALCLAFLWAAMSGATGSPGLLAPACLALLLLSGAAAVAAAWPAAALLMSVAGAGSAGLGGWRIDGAAPWFGAGLAVVLAGLLAVLALDSGRRWLLPVLAVGTTLAVVGAAELLGVERSVVASAELVLVAVSPRWLPRLALAAADPGDAEVDNQAAVALAGSVRGLVDALSAAAAAVLLVLALVLVATGPEAAPLVAVSGLLLVLRARGSIVRVVTGALTGSCCLLASVDSLAASEVCPWLVAWAVPAVIAGGAVVSGVRPPAFSASAQRALDRAEVAAVVLLPVLALVASGALDWIRRTA